jgi:sugar phosphate isomerase/epimerase
MTLPSLSRRSFFGLAATSPLFAALKGKKIPIGLELFSVRGELTKDLPGTVRAVAKMGYECVEFYGNYSAWKPDYAKDVRKLLDDLGIRCSSTHNGGKDFSAANLPKTIELNQILGSKFVVMASAGKVVGLDGWKKVADTLNQAAEALNPVGLRTGYHNHQPEFMPLEGKRPIDVLAENTTHDVMLQLDVGTCLHAGADPVAWIEKNPGRINSLHLKDWSPDPGKDYKVLFGEGVAPWKKILQAAEKTGGVEYYLIEQEGSDYPALETVQRCLASYHKLHG